MNNQLPLKIDPFALMRQGGAHYEGFVAVAELPRLCGILGNAQGQIKVKLEVGQNKFEPVHIVGTCVAKLQTDCQRCGEPVYCDINVEFKLSPVITDAQSPSVPKEYEPWVTNNEPIAVHDLVEEEVILSLPMFAKHAPEVCQVKLPGVDGG